MSFVNHAEEQDALAFGQELQERLREKVGVALEQKKVEVAQSLFGVEPVNEQKVPDHQHKVGDVVHHNDLPSGTGIIKRIYDSGHAAVLDSKKNTHHAIPTDELVPDEIKKEETVNENQWLQGAVHPSRAGMFDGVSVESMEKELSHLKATGPHSAGSHEATREHQLTFAIRAKRGHGFH